MRFFKNVLVFRSKHLLLNVISLDLHVRARTHTHTHTHNTTKTVISVFCFHRYHVILIFHL